MRWIDKWGEFTKEMLTILDDAGVPGSKEQLTNYMIEWARITNAPPSEDEIRWYIDRTYGFLSEAYS